MVKEFVFVFCLCCNLSYLEVLIFAVASQLMMSESDVLTADYRIIQEIQLPWSNQLQFTAPPHCIHTGAII